MHYIKIFFKAKHSQLFATFVVVVFIQSISQGFNELISAAFYILYIILYTGWLLGIGIGLRTMMEKPSMNYSLFLAAGLVPMVIIVIRLLALIEAIDMTDLANGTFVIFVLVFVLTSLGILCSYGAKNLKKKEKGNDIDINDYFWDIFRLVFWPIGIWNIQPRINRIADQLVS